MLRRAKSGHRVGSQKKKNKEPEANIAVGWRTAIQLAAGGCVCAVIADSAGERERGREGEERGEKEMGLERD